MQDLTLTRRDRLPDALRVLLAEYPREAWERDPNFAGMVQFWLERHLMFRRLTEALETDAQALLDRQIEVQSYRTRLARLGNMLLGQLHQHHHVEDDHYFPLLRPLEPALDRGFDVLDADHQALDGLMQAFAAAANAALEPGSDRVGADVAGSVLTGTRGLRTGLLRHLEDEEDLIVPVLLRHGAPGL